MKRDKLPTVLVEWLENRDFRFRTFESNEPGYLTKDEIYSAAVELKSDMDWDTHNDDFTSREKATITRFVNREKTTHKYISLDKWY